MLLLPADMVSLEDLQHKPEQTTPGTLMHFVLSLGGGMLRDGISFGVANDDQTGVRVCLVEDDVRIDLTDSAVSDLLLEHMLPRFRALLRGNVVVDHSGPKPREAGKADQAEASVKESVEKLKDAAGNVKDAFKK